MFALPPDDMLTFPPVAGILTLLVPLAKLPPLILPDMLPTNVVAINAPLAKFALINVLLACA